MEKHDHDGETVIRRLTELGALKVRQVGSHATFAFGSYRTTVPVHRGDLGIGLLRAIQKDVETCFGEGWLLK